LRAELTFDYDGKIVRHEGEAPKTVFQPQRKSV
jgi:hypothetical protein